MGSDYETLPPPPGAPGGIGAESESTDGSLEQPMAANIQDKIPCGGRDRPPHERHRGDIALNSSPGAS